MSVYDFAIGQTNPETFPVEAFKQAAVRAIENEHEMFNQYPGALGHRRLRELMAERESQREGVPVDPDQIALTNGSMQAVTLTGQALLDGNDDIVITEEFTYIGTISAYKGIGLEMVGIPLDEDGMRMDALEETLARLAAEGRRPKFIYALTTYQNPTGTNMPLARKRELIRIAADYSVPLVEDNCYGDVHFDGDKVPCAFALDPGPDQVYLGSLSKILAPGVRLGYVLAREPMLSRIVARRYDAGSNYFAAAVVAEFYRNGIWDHCEVANPVLAHKRDLLTGALAATLDDICVWSNPVGGLFLWLRMPDDVDMAKLMGAAAERNLSFMPGAAFHVEGKQVPYLRLAFGHVPDALIPEGIDILAQCIKEARTSNERRSFDSLF